MALPNLDKSKPPGSRVADLARSVADDHASGISLNLYQRLSLLQCWDAALLCAWSANGIQCAQVNMTASGFGVIQVNSFSRLFGANPAKVPSIGHLMNLPRGCFIGFVRKGVLRHVMLHIGQGFGAGNKNDCVLKSGKSVGWEKLDMADFFRPGKSADHNNNKETDMIYIAVNGQTV